MKLLNLVCAALVFLGVSAVNAQTLSNHAVNVRSPIASLRWTVANQVELTAMLGTPLQATEAIRNMLEDEAQTYRFAKVAEYTFVDFEGSGELSIVAIMNMGGNGVTSSVVVLTNRRGSVRRAEIDTRGLSVFNVASLVVDIHRDGRRELLIPSLSSDEGVGLSAPVETFRHIYKVVDGVVYLADTEFLEYYATTRIPEIERRLSALRELRAASPEESMRNAREQEILAAERQRIRANLGI